MSNPNSLSTLLNTGRRGTAYEFSIDSLKFSKNLWDLTLVIKNDAEMDAIDVTADCSFVVSPFKKQSQLQDLLVSYNSNQTSLDNGETVYKKMSDIIAQYEVDKEQVKSFDFTAGVVKYSSGNSTKITFRINAVTALKLMQSYNTIVASCAVCIASVNVE